MPGVSGVTVVTNACAYYTAHAAAGASGARHSLRPLITQGQEFKAKLARIARRDREAMAAHGCCLKIASVANHIVPAESRDNEKKGTAAPYARQSKIQSCRASMRCAPIALIARSRAKAAGPVR